MDDPKPVEKQSFLEFLCSLYCPIDPLKKTAYDYLHKDDAHPYRRDSSSSIFDKKKE